MLQRSSGSVVCKICGEKFEGDLALHLAVSHQDLSFRCAALPSAQCHLHFTSLEEATDHLHQKHGERLRAVSSNSLSLLLLPGIEYFRRFKEVDFGAWAAVRCKNSSCDFIGIGLKQSAAVHLEKCHPEEGLENLNIYCRICEPDVLRAQAVNNFDDEEELVLHMNSEHKAVIERIKGPQQLLSLNL